MVVKKVLFRLITVKPVWNQRVRSLHQSAPGDGPKQSP